MGDYPLFIARVTIIGGLRRGPGGDRKAPWLLWGKREAGIGLETDHTLYKVRFRPHGRPKGFPVVRLRFAPETRLRRLPTGQFVSFGNLRVPSV